MKKLDDVFKKDKGKKSSILNKKIKTNKTLTVSRKIYQDDYEIIRSFAYENRITLLETTEYLYDSIKDKNLQLEEEKIVNHISEINKENLKNIRIPKDFNRILRGISEEYNLPPRYSRYLFSFLVHEHLKDEEA